MTVESEVWEGAFRTNRRVGKLPKFKRGAASKFLYFFLLPPATQPSFWLPILGSS